MKEKRERESERKEGEGEKERQVGQVLAYLTSMDVNLCFSASMSADLHKLWRRYYIKTIYSFAISAGKAHPHPWTSLFT